MVPVMSQEMSPAREKLNGARKKEKPLALRKIEKFLSKSKTYLGAIYLSSFEKLLVKAKKYSLIVHCNNHWFCIYSTEKTFEILILWAFCKNRNVLVKNF